MGFADLALQVSVGFASIWESFKGRHVKASVFPFTSPRALSDLYYHNRYTRSPTRPYQNPQKSSSLPSPLFPSPPITHAHLCTVTPA